MKKILLSGGSGSRLWPLSNPIRSKQFIKILPKNNNELESMIQRTYRLLKEVGLNEETFLTISSDQLEVTKNQLDENVKFIVEPEQGDTFSAISLATLYLINNKIVSEEDSIVVVPVDAFVDKTFYENLKKLALHTNFPDVDLALMGVSAKEPKTEYGYIIPEESSINDYKHIKKFIEKPDCNTARLLVEKGAFWNCGVFAFQANTLLRVLKEKNIPNDYFSFLNNYTKMNFKSFDYEVVENLNNIVVCPYNGTWMDIGNWLNIDKVLSRKVIGKGYLNEKSKNTTLINTLNIPVMISGVTNSIVITSPDGIAVLDKNESINLKNENPFKFDRIKYEEKRWGYYEVLDCQKQVNQYVTTKKLYIKEGKNISYQYHNFRNESWTIVKGTGEFVLDGELHLLGVGDIVKIPKKVKHAIKANSDLEIVEVQWGNLVDEKDIVRISINWEEILKLQSNQINPILT